MQLLRLEARQMVTDPNLIIEDTQEEMALDVPQSPRFFDGQMSAGFPAPEAPPEGLLGEQQPEEVQVAGMGQTISLFNKARKLIDEARAVDPNKKFKREGSVDLENDPLGLVNEGDRLSEPVPSADTGVLENVGEATSTVGKVPKAVKLKVNKGKVTEVNEMYKRFTTDTPFSALDDFNAYRLDTDEDVMAVIAATSKTYAKEITDETGGQITHNATRHMADLVGASQGRLMTKLLGGEILVGKRPGEVAANMLAARDLLVWSAQKVDGLAKLLVDNDAVTLTAAGFKNAEELAVALQRQSALHAGIQAKVKGATTEIARAQSAQRIAAGGGVLDEAAINSMVQSSGGIDYMRKMAAMHLQLGTPEKRAKMHRLLNNTLGQKTLDALYEVWINALLSNPVTHVVNMIGNTTHLLGQVPVRGVAAVFARGRRAITGAEDGVQGGEGTAMMFATKMAFRDAVKMAGHAFKDPATGLAKVEPGKKFRQNAFSAENFGMSGLPGKAFDLAGSLLTMGRGATRGLAMGDVFFKVLGQRMETYARAYRETAFEFGSEVASRPDEFAEALAHRIENPSDEVIKDSFEFGQMATFTNELGTLGKHAQGFSNNAFVRWFIPFLKTPTNIMARAWEYTPFNVFANNFRVSIEKGGHHADLAMARVSLGTSAGATVMSMASEGLITGGGPSDPRLRANRTRQGWQPYSFKIGDKYYSYKRIEPYSTIIGIAADMEEIRGNASAEEWEKSVAALGMAMAKNVTSKTYMSGLSKLVDVLENPDKMTKKALENFIKSLSPRIVAQVEKVIDPTVRETRTMVDAMRQDIPGWSEGLPAKIDLWGRAMVNEVGPYGTGMINPIYMSEVKPNIVDPEMDRLKIAMSPLSDMIPGIKSDYKLTPEEYHDYAVEAGKNAFIESKKMVTSRDYERATDAGKKILLSAAIRKGQKIGLQWLLEKSKHSKEIIKTIEDIIQLRVKELTP